ncbi:MAG: hypothetical protein H3C48_00640 [Chitinophagaceae bacterium]|nr:hypothetical protein [Chitinophagaceae bacterium]
MQITKKDIHGVGLTIGDVARILRVHYNTVLRALKKETITTGRIRNLIAERRKQWN